MVIRRVGGTGPGPGWMASIFPLVLGTASWDSLSCWLQGTKPVSLTQYLEPSLGRSRHSIEVALLTERVPSREVSLFRCPVGALSRLGQQ